MPQTAFSTNLTERLRLIFMGTATLSGHSLRALLKWPGCQVDAVVTQPDRPKGRDLHLLPSPVKQVALEAGLAVIQPERARSEEFLHEVQRLRPDLIVVAAYGQILPQALLDVPRFGCLNVHTSLLPKYRGAAPIQWALLNDEQETGVTIMKMDAGMDTGAILTQKATPILPGDTSETLHDRLAEIGAALLVETIPPFVAGRIQPRPQPTDQVSYAPKIKKEDGRINWQRPARTIWNRTRGLVPWPGAFTFLPAQPKPLLLKIWQAEVAQLAGAPGHVLQADKNGILVACGQGAIRILSVQREGGRRITAQQFLSGHSLGIGQHFC